MVLLESNTKAKGRIAEDFSLEGVDGKNYSLDTFKDRKGVAIIFTCNHCPYAIASWPIIKTLSQQYQDIGFICINSNDPDIVPDDSFKNMKILSETEGFLFPYVIDPNHIIADKYDAQCTPDNYLLKNNGDNFELFFQGRFNDNRQNPAQSKSKDFEDHMIKLLNNENPEETWFPSMGCSIKRKFK